MECSILLSFRVIASISPAAPAAPTLTGEIFWAIKACRAGQQSSFGEQSPACLSERDNRAVKFQLLYSVGSLQHSCSQRDCQVVWAHTALDAVIAVSHLSFKHQHLPNGCEVCSSEVQLQAQGAQPPGFTKTTSSVPFFQATKLNLVCFTSI